MSQMDDCVAGTPSSRAEGLGGLGRRFLCRRWYSAVCACIPHPRQRHHMGVEFRAASSGRRSGADRHAGREQEGSSGRARRGHPSGSGLPAGSSRAPLRLCAAAGSRRRPAQPGGQAAQIPRSGPPGRAAASLQGRCAPSQGQTDRGDRLRCQSGVLLRPGGQAARRGQVFRGFRWRAAGGSERIVIAAQPRPTNFLNHQRCVGPSSVKRPLADRPAQRPASSPVESKPMAQKQQTGMSPSVRPSSAGPAAAAGSPLCLRSLASRLEARTVDRVGQMGLPASPV